MPGNNKNQAQLVFELFKEAGDNGLTSGEAADKLGMPIGSISTRVSQLCRACCLIETPRNRKGKNKSTRAVIYQIDPSAEFSMYTKYITAMGTKLRGKPTETKRVTNIQEDIRGARNLSRVSSKRTSESVAVAKTPEPEPSSEPVVEPSAHLVPEPALDPVVKPSPDPTRGNHRSRPTLEFPGSAGGGYKRDHGLLPAHSGSNHSGGNHSGSNHEPSPGSRPFSENSKLGSWEARVLNAADTFRRNPSRRNKRRLLTVARFLV